MKGIILVMMTALVIGCSTSNTPQPEPAAPVATAPVITDPVPVTVMNTEPAVTTPRPNSPRIDAAAFLQALIDSGCIIDKAQYKEVARGGGITVECADDSDILEKDGLDDL